MQCDNVTQSAEHLALPRFPKPVRVRSVSLWACAPPTVPYATVLATLNVTVTDALRLENLPVAPPLREDHFEGLRSLVRLHLHSTSRAAFLPQNILVPLLALRDLELEYIQVGTTLEVLPTNLSSLRLKFTGMKLFGPAGILGLKHLSVWEEGAVFVNVTGTTALSSLHVKSFDSSVVDVTRLPSLVSLNIEFWSETRPEPWVECGALKYLTLINSASPQQTVLPDGWLSRCTVLSKLSIYEVPLAPLPPHLLDNMPSLKKLSLSGCSLKELPKDLFNNTTQLISLDLSYNRLEELSSDLFVSLRALKSLILSGNLLTASIAPALQPLSSLKILELAHNMQLSDLCDDETDTVTTRAGMSSLQLMTGLTELVLRNTSVSRVCRDWRENMPHLMYLDLTETNITVLKYEDVVQRRSKPGAKVKISSKSLIVRLEYSFEDYERARVELVAPGDVKTSIFAKVECDCNAYWAALAFREGSRHTRLHAPHCTMGKKSSLRNVSPDELTCSKPELCTNLQGCSCVSRDDPEWRGGVATAWCENSGLTSIPGPPPNGFVWRLMLANNSISSVNAAELPPHLHELDLRHNALEGFDKDTAAALRTRSVRLENNPLRCDCDALGLLEIATWPERIDLKNVTCGVGSKIASLERLAAECAPERLATADVA